MDNRFYLIDLFDYYSELLTEKQKEYFQDYYFNNLSLSEMSNNKGISRNAIYKQLKDCENKLTYYEEKLHLYEKSKKIKELIKDLSIRDKIEELI